MIEHFSDRAEVSCNDENGPPTTSNLIALMPFIAR
jgi:hypothetical protein